MCNIGNTFGKRLVAIILLVVMVFGNASIPAQAADNNKGKNVAIIRQDKYRRTLCKGFLGKSYGSVIDGIRCDCSGYTRAALNRMQSKCKNGAVFKDVSVGAVCSSAWVSGSTVTYTTGIAENGAITWDKPTTLDIGGTTTGATKLSELELGDVMVYGRGNYTTHIAVYFGKFSSMDEVKDYLVELGLYEQDDFRKVSGGKYQVNGRTVIRQYTNSSYWRIHSTNSGILIDNDIALTSPYTSSFGEWKWTFSTGLDVADET